MVLNWVNAHAESGEGRNQRATHRWEENGEAEGGKDANKQVVLPPR